VNANAIRTRIYNVVPAASWQMEGLLSLLDIVPDTSIQTACVDCTSRPRLRLNPSFLETHCATDEHLLMLVLHELHHVVLGHTRLFPRPTKAHNIAFDAVINALLCHQFPEERYWSFFTSVNDAATFPARLLRPPRRWPRSLALPPDATAGEKRVVELLYGPAKVGATYLEVFELLVQSLQGGGDGSFVLLGNHSGNAEDDTGDPFFQQAIRDIVAKWPRPDRILSGRDQGTPSYAWHLDATQSVQPPLQRAFEVLLRKAGVCESSVSAPRRVAPVSNLRAIETVVPQPRDRRIPAWRSLHGAWPLIYRGEWREERRQRVPQPVAHVYLDISGSMHSILPPIAAALRRPHRKGLLRLFVFSTVVGEVEPRNLGCQVANTFGTDINCVLAHLEGIRPAKRPRRVVVVTDGWVGRPHETCVRNLSRIRFTAAIAGNDPGEDFKPLNARIVRLPV
jgi:hypothetical protein